LLESNEEYTTTWSFYC